MLIIYRSNDILSARDELVRKLEPPFYTVRSR